MPAFAFQFNVSGGLDYLHGKTGYSIQDANQENEINIPLNSFMAGVNFEVDLTSGFLFDISAKTNIGIENSISRNVTVPIVVDGVVTGTKTLYDKDCNVDSKTI